MGGKGKNTGINKNSGAAPLVNNGFSMATGSQNVQLQQGEQQFNCQPSNQQQELYDPINMQQAHQFQDIQTHNQFNNPTPPPYNNNISVGQNLAHQGYSNQNINTTNQTGLIAPVSAHPYNNSQLDNGMLNIMQQIQNTNATVLSRLSSIECSVSKLTTIENDLSMLRLDVSKLKRENGSMFNVHQNIGGRELMSNHKLHF